MYYEKPMVSFVVCLLFVLTGLYIDFICSFFRTHFL